MFIKGPSANVKIVLLLAVSIVLMTVDHRHGHLQSMRSLLSVAVYPLQYVVNLPVATGRWISESLVTRGMLLDDNQKLREDHLLLSSRVQRFAVIEEENRRLRELLESSIQLRERVLVAELLAVELEPFRRQVIINKGRREGAYDGQPVVDAGGVMGQIIHVGPFSSTVLLITDPSHALPVQVNRNGLRAIAVGTGRDNALLLEHLPTNADIRKGDLVISSGLGHRFPRGYPVGTIADIGFEPGEPFARVEVTPSAKIGQSREVLLVWPQQVEGETVGGDEVAANQ